MLSATIDAPTESVSFLAFRRPPPASGALLAVFPEMVSSVRVAVSKFLMPPP